MERTKTERGTACFREFDDNSLSEGEEKCVRILK
jgi:hypothetical protein